MNVTIPSQVVENRREPFPAGLFDGELIESGDQESRGDAEHLFLRTRWGRMEPVGDSPDPGNRTYLTDIFLIWEDEDGVRHSIADLTEIDDDTPFVLQRSAGVLAGIAKAFGAGTVDEEGNVTLNLADFIAQLRNTEAYVGQRARLQIRHRESEGQDGRTYTNADLVRVEPVEQMASVS